MRPIDSLERARLCRSALRIMKKRTACDAYKVFKINRNRAEAFVRIFDAPGGTPRRQGQPSNDEKELLRGAVVFAVGALDAFLHELILEIVPRFGGDRTRLNDALKQIAKDDPALALRVSLARDGEEKRCEFRDALDGWLSEKSFQGSAAVERALGFVNCRIEWADFDTASGMHTAERLQHYTKVRHSIVHRGAKPTVNRSEAGECVELIKSIAKLVNHRCIAFYDASCGIA